MNTIKSPFLHQCRLHCNGNGFKIVQKSFTQTSSNLQEANHLGFTCQQNFVRPIGIHRRILLGRNNPESGHRLIPFSFMVLVLQFENQVCHFRTQVVHTNKTPHPSSSKPNICAFGEKLP